MKGSVEIRQIEAASLSGNPLNDPHRRATPIYLPPGYAQSQSRYPTVYFLHGFSGRGLSWTNVSPFTLTVPERLDALIDADVIPPVIGVFPDGWTSLGGSQWLNSIATGRYEDYVFKDVVQFVDREFRTVPSPAARAVVGKSSGGYGALVMGCHHSDVFGHIGVHSADAYFEYCYLPSFPKAASGLLRSDGVQDWYDDFIVRARETRVRSEDFPVIEILAMSAVYSPNLEEPMKLELPFEPQTARLIPEVWERWLQKDPVRFIGQHVEGLRRLGSIFLDCGLRDEYNLQWGAQMIAEGFRRAQVIFRQEEFENGHMGINYRYDESLRYLGPKLATR